MGESWGLSVRNWGNLLYKAITVLWGYEYEVWFLRDGVGILVRGGVKGEAITLLKITTYLDNVCKTIWEFFRYSDIIPGKIKHGDREP